ncbi:hypothetical protein J6590_039284 [Homalodisca vitripennis]|nr:hypothetical protein J6590_039284 [Homalodisca vitripennis]
MVESVLAVTITAKQRTASSLPWYEAVNLIGKRTVGVDSGSQAGTVDPLSDSRVSFDEGLTGDRRTHSTALERLFRDLYSVSDKYYSADYCLFTSSF